MDTGEVVALFERFQRGFPQLKMTLDHEHPQVDLNLDIPEQPGLIFAMNLNLQGDELHLHAGAFWLEWFPCSRLEIVEAYWDAVKGLLSGAYRIIEYRRGKHTVRAELQCPKGPEWRTIGTWSTLDLWFWLPKSSRVLQNDTQTDRPTATG